MQKPNQRLKGQTCIVTGSSSGIGKAVAIAIGKEGANVIINYHSSKEEAEEVAHEISECKLSGDSIVVKADVGKENEVKKIFKAGINKFGTIDICVPNAGMQQDAALHEMTLD